jgi:hypothetical protein
MKPYVQESVALAAYRGRELSRAREPKKRFQVKRAAVGLLGVIAAAGIFGAGTSPAHATTTWNTGDIFLGVANGSYQVRQQDGTLKETLNSGLGGFTTGCAFDADDDFYGTQFSANAVAAFEGPNAPHTQTAFGGGYSTPESIAFDAAGNAFVGNLFNGILKFDSAGVFQANVINTRVDFLDVAADQDTIYYTQEGNDINAVSITSGPLPNFTTGTTTRAFALRILPDGGVLLADLTQVKRFDASGVLTQTYDVGGEDSWFSLNLDPNGTSFWAGNFDTANYYKFNITSGAVEAGPLNTGTGSGTLFGICILGEPTAAIPNISLDPPTATNPAGSQHTVTATLTAGANAAADVPVSFEVTGGPNIGEVSDDGECSVNADCTTDANGQVSWSYTSNGLIGVDTIEACFTDVNGAEHCTTATKEWIDGTPPDVGCTPTTNPAGKNIPKAGSNPKSGQNPDGFYQLGAVDNVDPNPQIFVVDSASGFSAGPFANGDNVKITQAPGVTPSVEPMAGVIGAHIKINGDALISAVDLNGNVGGPVACLVPPPPK